MLDKLGTTLFGIWTLIYVVTSYTQLADFGLGRSIIKFVAEYDAKKDEVGLAEIINTSLMIYIMLGSIAFTLFSSMTTFSPLSIIFLMSRSEFIRV